MITTPNALCVVVVVGGCGGNAKATTVVGWWQGSDKHGEECEDKERPAVVLVAKGVVGAEDRRRVHLDGAVVVVLVAALAFLVRDAKEVCLDGEVLDAHLVLAALLHLRAEARGQHVALAVGLHHTDLVLGRPLKLHHLVRAHPVDLRVQRAGVAEREAPHLCCVPLEERRRLLAHPLQQPQKIASCCCFLLCCACVRARTHKKVRGVCGDGHDAEDGQQKASNDAQPHHNPVRAGCVLLACPFPRRKCVFVSAANLD